MGTRVPERLGYVVWATIIASAVRPVGATAQHVEAAAAADEADMGTSQGSRGSATAVGDGGDELDLAGALRQGDEALSLEQAVALAVRTAPSVARAQAIAAEARGAASESVAALYPRLDLVAQYRRLSRPPLIVYPLPPDIVDGYSAVAFPRPLVDQYLLRARVSYPVSELFFSILPRYRAARETARAQELNARAAAFSVALSAREAYFNYARARALQVVARFGVEEAEAQLEDVALMVETGSQPRVERMRAEANLTAARVSAARSSGSVAVARSALRSLIHRRGGAEFSIREDLMALLPPLRKDRDALLQEAVKNRSELRALRMAARARHRSMRASAAEGLPRLTVAASADEANPNQRAALFRREWTGSWDAMVMLSWSPTDLATGSSRAEQIEAQRGQILADLMELEDALDREVSAAYEDYGAARQAMVAALSGIEAAEESYRVRRVQLRAGAVPATEVIISEGDLVRARLDLINASIDLRIARARLDRAVEHGEAG